MTTTIPTADRDFVISRVFDAPRDLVFNAWTDSKQMARWWGPKSFANPVCEIDARPGGSYRITMRSPEGVDYPMRGKFIEVTPPAKIVMTMDCTEHPPEWHDMVKPNRSKDEINPAGVMLTTVTFDDEAGKTRLTVRMTFASAELLASMRKMGMNEGWSQSLDRLAELVGARDSSP